MHIDIRRTFFKNQSNYFQHLFLLTVVLLLKSLLFFFIFLVLINFTTPPPIFLERDKTFHLPVCRPILICTISFDPFGKVLGENMETPPLLMKGDNFFLLIICGTYTDHCYELRTNHRR